MNKFRPRIYVTLDFEFSPMHFHNGEGATERDGCLFQGLGKDLQFQHTDSVNRVENKTTITLPFSRKIKTAFQQETHRERDVTCEIFAVNGAGHHVKRLCYRKGRISVHTVSDDDDNITLAVKDDVFDSHLVKDKRYKAKVTEVRGRFIREMYETFKTTILGCVVSLILGLTIDPLAGLATFLLSLWPMRNVIRQRLSARQRLFWIETEPEIPLKWKRKRGYKYRADTLDEAIEKLHADIVPRVWLFPREWQMIIITPQGQPPRYLSLEKIRLHDNPERCKETGPKWPP